MLSEIYAIKKGVEGAKRRSPLNVDVLHDKIYYLKEYLAITDWIEKWVTF